MDPPEVMILSYAKDMAHETVDIKELSSANFKTKETKWNIQDLLLISVFAVFALILLYYMLR